MLSTRTRERAWWLIMGVTLGASLGYGATQLTNAVTGFVFFISVVMLGGLGTLALIVVDQIDLQERRYQEQMRQLEQQRTPNGAG